ncbi:hypothetical protein ACU4GA_16820 [Methylobacterium oryzae CBMB20]
MLDDRGRRARRRRDTEGRRAGPARGGRGLALNGEFLEGDGGLAEGGEGASGEQEREAPPRRTVLSEVIGGLV